MKVQLLGDNILDRLPATISAITFTDFNQGSSMSKIKYYVN